MKIRSLRVAQVPRCDLACTQDVTTARPRQSARVRNWSQKTAHLVRAGVRVLIHERIEKHNLSMT